MLSAIQRQAASRTSTAATRILAEMNAAAAQLALARVTKAVTVTSASVGIAKHSISRSARPISGLNMRTQTISSTPNVTGPNTANWLATGLGSAPQPNLTFRRFGALARLDAGGGSCRFRKHVKGLAESGDHFAILPSAVR